MSVLKGLMIRAVRCCFRSQEWKSDPYEGRTIDFSVTRISYPGSVCRQNGKKCTYNSSSSVNAGLFPKTLWEDSAFWLELLLAMTLLGDFLYGLCNESLSASLLGNWALWISGDGRPFHGTNVPIKLHHFSVYVLYWLRACSFIHHQQKFCYWLQANSTSEE